MNAATATKPAPALDADVVIAGGGMVGLTAACALAGAGLRGDRGRRAGDPRPRWRRPMTAAPRRSRWARPGCWRASVCGTAGPRGRADPGHPGRRRPSRSAASRRCSCITTTATWATSRSATSSRTARSAGRWPCWRRAAAACEVVAPGRVVERRPRRSSPARAWAGGRPQDHRIAGGRRGRPQFSALRAAAGIRTSPSGATTRPRSSAPCATRAAMPASRWNCSCRAGRSPCCR